MPALSADQFTALLSSRCACGRSHRRARAFATGAISVLDGEASGGVTFRYAPESLHQRVYRVECADCRVVAWERTDCPGCGGGGGVARALARQNGLVTPSACPACQHPELRLTAELRMHVVFVEGRIARRVADAAFHEPGFHVTAIDCPGCERTVGKAGDDCAVCGRSSLLKRIR